jgi:uncharacterized repeat protein (TIGR01451 family)
MRRYTTVLWLLPATVLLVLFASSVLGTPTRAAPQYNITPGTEPPTSTPTEPPPPSATATNTPGGPSVTPTDTPDGPSVTPTDTPGGPSVTPTNTPGGPSVTPTPPEPTGVLPPPPGRGDDGGDDDDEPGPTPDVGLFKQADTSSARPGADVTYTITVMNRGTASAIDVVVTDNLPEGMEIGDVTATRGDVSRDGRSLTVRIGDMEPGETVTIVVRARVSDTVTAADLRNNAVAESGPPEQRMRLEASVNVTVELTGTPTVTAATPVPRSAPLPNQTTPNNRLPRTGTLFADVFDLALLLVLAAGALFCLSMAARAYRRS